MSRTVAAIVAGQHDNAIAAVRSCFSALRESETQLDKIGKRFEAAKGAAEMRRIELGRALIAARALWPTVKAAQGGARGPGGKTWTQFLEEEGLNEATAFRYQKLAGAVGEAEADDWSFHVKGPTYAQIGLDNRPHGPRPNPDTPNLPPGLSMPSADDDFDPVPQPMAPVAPAGFDLRLGDWRSVLLGAGVVDVLITDPPYGKRAHGASTTRADGVDPAGLTPDYEHWTADDVLAFVEQWSPRVRGWMVALTSHDLIPAWEAAYLAVGRYGFAPVPCVITGMSVRMVGDGPSSWAVYAMVARPRTGEFSRWGTLPGAHVGPAQAGAEGGRGKPTWLTDQLVAHYSRPNDLVCDPLAGYGGTLISALAAGRRALGCELDHDAYEEAYRRAARAAAKTQAPDTAA